MGNHITVQEYLPASEIPARGAGGWGFRTVHTTLFNHDSAYIRCPDTLRTSFYNDHDFSAEVWFKPDCRNGNLMTLLDDYGDVIFTLTLKDCILHFQRILQYKLFEIQSSDTCTQNEWNYVQWISGTVTDTIRQRLYLNRQLVAEQQSAIVHYPIGFETLSGHLKIGFDAALESSSYRGEIYAAELKTEEFGSVYNNAHYPLDGSGYFGLPYYRYYRSGSDIYQKRIRASKVPIAAAVFVPYSNDGYIPQGLTNTYEDDQFTGDSDMVYISLYHRDIDGTTGNQRSIIVELDSGKDYQVRRCFRMNGELATAHMTAMAYRGGNILLTCGGKGFRLEIPEYSGAGREKYQTLGYVWSQSMYSASATYFSDTLWCCTKFADEAGETAYLAGYPMNLSGVVDLAAKPTYYMLPMYVQGAAWTKFQGQDYLFASCSFGDRDSKLYRYSRSKLSRWELAEPDTIFYLPAGTEDVTFNRAGNLMVSSESSALYYSSRTSNPWSQFFPFIFEISREVLFADRVNGGTGTQSQGLSILPGEYELVAYPNPFNNRLSIHYKVGNAVTSLLNIYDLRGRIIDSVSHESVDSRSYIHYTWNPEKLASGVYLIQLLVDDIPTRSRKVVLLK
ncbi:MAG: T9SS type A sorting domain-containing protein [Fidelibacterota bacterium]